MARNPDSPQALKRFAHFNNPMPDPNIQMVKERAQHRPARVHERIDIKMVTEETQIMSQWIAVCQLDDITVGTGVCALVEQDQVAIFRPYQDERLYALSNIDPFARKRGFYQGD